MQSAYDPILQYFGLNYELTDQVNLLSSKRSKPGEETVKLTTLTLFLLTCGGLANATEPEGFDGVVATTCATGDLGQARLIQGAIISVESERLIEVAEGWNTLAAKIENQVETRQLKPNEIEKLQFLANELQTSSSRLQASAEELAEVGVGIMITTLAVPTDLKPKELWAKCQTEFEPVRSALETAWLSESTETKHLEPLLNDYQSMKAQLDSAFLKDQSLLENFSRPVLTPTSP